MRAILIAYVLLALACHILGNIHNGEEYSCSEGTSFDLVGCRSYLFYGYVSSYSRPEYRSHLQAVSRSACFFSEACSIALQQLTCAEWYRPCLPGSLSPLPLCIDLCDNYNQECQEYFKTGELEPRNCNDTDQFSPNNASLFIRNDTSQCAHWVPLRTQVEGIICPGESKKLVRTDSGNTNAFIFTNSSTQSCQHISILDVALPPDAPPHSVSPYFAPLPAWPKKGAEWEWSTRSKVFTNANGDIVAATTYVPGFRVQAATSFYNVSVQSRWSQSPVWLLDIAIYHENNDTITPLELALAPSAEDEIFNPPCFNISELKPLTTYLIIARYPKNDLKSDPFTSYDRVAVVMTASLYATATVASFVLLGLGIYRLRYAAPKSPVTWLVLCFGCANSLRAIYFFVMALDSKRSESTTMDLGIVELPLIIRFTAGTLMALFWISVLITSNRVRQQAQLWKFFWRSFTISNIVIYLFFLIGIAAFKTFKRAIIQTCNFDEAFVYTKVNKVDDRAYTVVFLIYQVVIAIIGIIVAVLFLLGAGWTIKLLRQTQNATFRELRSSPVFRLCVASITMALSFSATATFLLVLALLRPGKPSLALVLAILELLPELLIYVNLPAQSPAIETKPQEEVDGSLLESANSNEPL